MKLNFGARKKRKFIKSGRFYVYILKCRDGTFYTGYTNNLKKRLTLHSAGKASKYTRARLPITLVWFKEYSQFRSAFLNEFRIKQLNRKQKELLVSSGQLIK